MSEEVLNIQNSLLSAQFNSMCFIGIILLERLSTYQGKYVQ